MPSLKKKITNEINGISQSRQRSVFSTIMAPMIFLVVTEVILLVSILVGTRVIERINRNSEDLILKQLQNRANYFSSSLYNWSDLEVLSATINSKAEALINDGTVNLDELQTNSEVSAPLIMEVVDDLVSTMYTKRLSGIYIVFNTTDLNEIPKMKRSPHRTGI